MGVSQPGSVGFSVLERGVVRDADLLFARPRPGHAKDVQVVVEPAHRVLKGDVQVPEAVGFGYLDPSPDGRLDSDEYEFELVDLSCRHHPAPRRLLPGEGLPFELLVAIVHSDPNILGGIPCSSVLESRSSHCSTTSRAARPSTSFFASSHP
jgi:hypothetical protein